MNTQYLNVTDSCSILIDIGGGNLWNFLTAEYADMMSEHCSGVVLGSITQISDITLPANATLLVDGRLYYSGNNVFLLSEGTLLQIRLERDTFRIFIDERTDTALVPLTLEALLNYYLPKHGMVYLHTAAFRYEGRVYAIQAFGGVGKTETALEYLLRGASYISDDIALFTDEGFIIPWPRCISLHDYPFTEEKLRTFGLSARLYRLKETLKTAKWFPLRNFYCRLRGRFNLRLSYRQLTTAPLPGRTPLPIDTAWWMEQGEETESFSIQQTDFLRKIQACMRHEFSSYVDFEGYLGVVYDFWPSLVQQHDEVLQKTVLALPQIKGLKIKDKDYYKAAEIIVDS